jgi:DNA repair exonuclease SbcCD ATPase subunit
MRILVAKAVNFNSYASLEFDFQNIGLALLQGSTGAGKSTFCDLIPWVLYGRTAKNGAVDDVCRWGATAPTVGELTLDIGGQTYTVVRSRGNNKNDLVIRNGTEIRGATISDTQQLINQLVGFDAEEFLSSAYFHEFSLAAQIFTLNAKTRKQVFEQLVDLRYAKNLSTELQDYKKTIKQELDKLKSRAIESRSRASTYEKLVQQSIAKAETWQSAHDHQTESLKHRLANHQQEYDKAYNKAKADLIDRRMRVQFNIDDYELNLTDTDYDSKIAELLAVTESKIAEFCESCGAPKNSAQKLIAMKDLNDIRQKKMSEERTKIQIASLKAQLAQMPTEPTINIPSPEALKQQLKTLEDTPNPLVSAIEDAQGHLKQAKTDVNLYSYEIDSMSVELADIELLEDFVSDLRVAQVKSTVEELETRTNKVLSDNYDAEMTVKFVLDNNEKLEVEIFKDGHASVYSQLSKGQRQLLKLSFGLSVMQLLNNTHHVNVLFFDEFADGLSEELKVKTFGLLSQIATEYETVFCVEHSTELKSRFSKVFQVSLIDGESQIEEI